MVYQETFLDGLHASTSTTYSGMLNSRDFSVTGSIPVQASTGETVTERGDRDHNQSWAQMALIPNSFQFLILQPEETIDWNSDALPERVYLKNSRVKKSQVSAKRWKEKIGGKVREEGPCAQSIWKQSQPQCWLEWWTVEPEAEVKTAQSRMTKIQWQHWMCMAIC